MVYRFHPPPPIYGGYEKRDKRAARDGSKNLTDQERGIVNQILHRIPIGARPRPFLPGQSYEHTWGRQPNESQPDENPLRHRMHDVWPFTIIVPSSAGFPKRPTCGVTVEISCGC